MNVSEQPFSRTTLWVVLGVAIISLAAAVVLTVLGDDLSEQQSAAANGYSKSAIGHRGLVELLSKLDIPVVVSRDNSAAKAEHGLLIVAEPSVADDAARARLKALVEAAPRTLLVLPKWYGRATLGAAWIDDASSVDLGDVDLVLEATGVKLKAVRPAAIDHYATVHDVQPTLAMPQLFVAAQPADVVARVFDSATDQILVGSVKTGDDKDVWILGDPDLINNAGLRAPSNARLAIELIDQLRDGGPVVIDETSHGYAQPPSIVRALLRFPLVLATLQVAICALLAVWAAMVRFGPARAAPPPLAPGKDFLIQNTAALLRYGGHHPHALRRYLQLTVQATRHALHAPSLPPTAMTAWLERVRATRGGTISLVELERNVETAETPHRVAELSDQIYRWRMEMTHGTDHRS